MARARWTRAALRRGLAFALSLAVALPAAPSSATMSDPVVADADWILSLQVSAGPDAGLIAMNEPRSLCVPYFANMAASGLASATMATGDPRYAQAAWRWLAWYAAHMDASGFVTDYELIAGVWSSTGDYDSTDAYAATFLSAVRDAYAATADGERLAGIWPAVGRATDAILATAAPGYLTYAKPGWNLAYAMDNAEVYDGWRAVAELAAVRGDAALAARAEEWIAGMSLSLAGFWNEPAGAYDVAIAAGGARRAADWSEFYPSVTAQVWMINTGLVPAARAAELATRIDQTHPAWDDPSSSGLFNPPEGPEIRAIGWWPSFADAFTQAGMQPRALAGFTGMRDAALTAGRAWPYHAGSAGRMIEFVVARPDTTIASGPAAWTSQTLATLTFAGSASAVSFECSLDGAPWVACTSPVAWPGLSEGSHAARVRAVDAAGHADPWVACTSPVAWPGLSEGSHAARVRAVDAAGHADPIPAAHAWTIDATPPVARLDAAPPDPGPIGSAVFAFFGSDDRSPSIGFECAVDGSAWSTCVSPASYPAIPTGGHEFRVRAKDLAGNVSSEAVHAWFADSVAPETTITAGPSGATWADQVSLEFAGSDDVAGPVSFECRLGSAAFAPCTSPVSYALPSEGAFLFSVRSVDGAGNRDASPATRAWFVDRSPPETWLTGGPAAMTTSRTARFTFAGMDTVSPSHWLFYECRLGDAPFARCASPVTVSALPDGSHVFEVRAVDAAGWSDPTPARMVWTIDTAPPSSAITTADQSVVAEVPPALRRVVRGTATDAGSGVRDVAVTFASSTGAAVRVAATLSCEDPSARSCTWTATAPAQPGRYQVAAIATDRAGAAESPGPAPIVIYAF